MNTTKVERELLARLRLARTDKVGPITYRALLERFGTAQAALEALPDLARRGGGGALTPCSRAAAEAEHAAVTRHGGRVLALGLAPYPARLASIEDAPPVLLVHGHVPLFDRPGIALVGARNASAAGQRLTREWAHALAAAGWCIISGLARGIDAAAHTAALDQSGSTIAAIAGGLAVPYPPENEALHHAIQARGLMVSEQPIDTVPQARHFPRRNRVISGLSQGVVVVEAAQRSGSLITARYAGEQGREVLAVPGSPLDPRAQGCNQLIRDGKARLVQSVDDILEDLNDLFSRRWGEPDKPYRQAEAAPVSDPSDRDRRTVRDALSPTPTAVDEILRATGLAPGVVQTILLELELAGRLTRHAGHRVASAA